MTDVLVDLDERPGTAKRYTLMIQFLAKLLFINSVMRSPLYWIQSHRLFLVAEYLQCTAQLLEALTRKTSSLLDSVLFSLTIAANLTSLYGCSCLRWIIKLIVDMIDMWRNEHMIRTAHIRPSSSVNVSLVAWTIMQSFSVSVWITDAFQRKY